MNTKQVLRASVNILLSKAESLRIFDGWTTRWKYAKHLDASLSRGKVTKRGWFEHFRRIRVIHFPFEFNPVFQASKEFRHLCLNMELGNGRTEYFYYWIDFNSISATHRQETPIGNVTIDYGRFLRQGFVGLQQSIQESLVTHKNSKFLKGGFFVLDGLRGLSGRIAKLVSDNPRIAAIFNEMDRGPANSLQDALQRILFLNQILWQCGHAHNGLGRLDQLLLPYYRSDLQLKVLDEESASNLLADFLKILHRDYEMKSAHILGDTGQIIILGGCNRDGAAAWNELTDIFLSLVGKLHQTEPKILLRIGANTNETQLQSGINCLRERTGSPLLSNDDVIIPLLMQYGYPIDDARDYGAAACWEPLIPGKSFDQGNVGSLNYMLELHNMVQARATLRGQDDFNELVQAIDMNLEEQTIKLLDRMDAIRWKPAPFMSLFLEGCIETARDASEGGALYNGYGFTTVGLGNLVDSVLNLRSLSLKPEFNFLDFQNALKSNFSGSQKLQSELQKSPVRYGADHSDVISFSNHFSSVVESIVKNRRNRFGGRIRFGYSSPEYIGAATAIPASPDGRSNGSPFYVHISSGITGASITDLVRFAGKLEYGECRLNGNVIDFVGDPVLIDKDSEHFRDFLKGAVTCGFFQMQMTFIDSSTLKNAMISPSKFPNLIVRVWGFSAYFNDLPDDYKHLVIDRTLRSETARR